jgi:effector-binding domain-containing protein
MTYTVEVKQVESQPIAVVRLRASVPQLTTVVPQACGVVWDYLKASKIKAGRNLAVYLDEQINLEVGAEVFGPINGDGQIVCSSTPAGSVLTTAHIGPYDQLPHAHETIRDWASQQHHALAGPNWEIYGHWTDDVSQLRTDVFYLLKGP